MGKYGDKNSQRNISQKTFQKTAITASKYLRIPLKNLIK
jgi:hypothetical protein